MDLLHLGTFYNKEEVDVVLCGCGTLWLWYFVDGYERKAPIYAAAEFLNNCLGGERMLHWA